MNYNLHIIYPALVVNMNQRKSDFKNDKKLH